MKYSFIIITLNKENSIGQCIKSVMHSVGDGNIEIIVSDGGSEDDTIKIASAFGVKVVNSNQGRGIQFNHAVEKSDGDIFVFLHSDSIFPEDGFRLLEKFFSDESNLITTFKLKFSTGGFLFSFYSWFTKFDSVFTTFGDQCISVRKNDFFRLGLFPQWPFFEDVHLLQKFRKEVKIKKLDAFIVTSARRFLRNGIIRQQLINFYLIIKYLTGIHPKRFASDYEPERPKVKTEVI